MVSRSNLMIQLFSHYLQFIYHLWTFPIRNPSRYPCWAPSPGGALPSKIQYSYCKYSTHYSIYPPRCHICRRPSVYLRWWPICTIIPRCQKPHPLSCRLTSPSHNVSLWPWCKYNPWAPTRGLPMRLPLPQYIKWPCQFFGQCIRTRLQQKMRNFLHRLLPFLYCRQFFRKKNSTSLCILF